MRSPVAIRGTERVEVVEIAANELFRDDDDMLRARTVEGASETIGAGLVLRSVGYRGVPLPDVPLDERRYVLPNEAGRVLDADSGQRRPGVYAVGWIKRGPTGILGTNKRDAAETVASLIEDWEAGALPEPSGGDVAEVLTGKKDIVTADGWRAIDGHEVAAGQSSERPRVKLASGDELLAVARPG